MHFRTSIIFLALLSLISRCQAPLPEKTTPARVASFMIPATMTQEPTGIRSLSTPRILPSSTASLTPTVRRNKSVVEETAIDDFDLIDVLNSLGAEIEHTGFVRFSPEDNPSEYTQVAIIEKIPGNKYRSQLYLSLYLSTSNEEAAKSLASDKAKHLDQGYVSIPDRRLGKFSGEAWLIRKELKILELGFVEGDIEVHLQLHSNLMPWADGSTKFTDITSVSNILINTGLVQKDKIMMMNKK